MPLESALQNGVLPFPPIGRVRATRNRAAIHSPGPGRPRVPRPHVGNELPAKPRQDLQATLAEGIVVDE